MSTIDRELEPSAPTFSVDGLREWMRDSGRHADPDSISDGELRDRLLTGLSTHEDRLYEVFDAVMDTAALPYET